MFQFKTIRRGQRVAVWSPRGDLRFVEGPRRLLLFFSRLEILPDYRAEADQYLVVRYVDGRIEHLRGPVQLWFHPIEHEAIEIRPVETIEANEAAMVYERRDANDVTRQVVRGPTQFMLAANEWVKRIPELRRYSAEAHQYLVVRFLDGGSEHLRGPAELWFAPDEHESITVEEATPVDSHQAVVIYRREPDETVSRRVVRGPAQYVPEANEWLHEFRWHGADRNDPTRKVPRGLNFSKLRVIPDQMYFDVHEVRSTDDALLTVKLMVFFELVDIEKMLNQTHDPIADFINALSADIIDFAASRSFEQFKQSTDQLNELAEYANLTGRAERIGYQIHKVVYRGYTASAKLQVMHDDAIERRTALKLESETERQAQELADLKLAREAEREIQRREMQRLQAEHEQQLKQMAHDRERQRKELDDQQQLAYQRQLHQAEIDHLQGENEQRLRFLHDIQGMQVDLTRYLVAQYQHPDRLIRIDGNNGNQFHLHDN